MPYINRTVAKTMPNIRAEAIEARVDIGLNFRKCGANCSNCGSSHAPRKCKAYGKECYHCHKQGHFSQFCHSKQCGKSLGSNVRSSSSNNRFSHCDVHEIDQSQFDDSVQFEQDSITIQFKTQM